MPNFLEELTLICSDNFDTSLELDSCYLVFWEDSFLFEKKIDLI